MTIATKRLRAPQLPSPPDFYPKASESERNPHGLHVDDDNNRTFSHLELKADNRIGDGGVLCCVVCCGLKKSCTAGLQVGFWAGYGMG